MAAGITEIKHRQRKMWASGDYPDVARLIEPVAAEMVERIGVGEGDEVLDVATGSGNVALEAAKAGAKKVVGLDLTPELLHVAKARAAHAGIDIEWLQGDAEALPFADASFDKVTSCFGSMFAPQQQQAANELVRTCRRGGTIAVTAWTPEGMNGQMFAITASMLPAPPPGVEPPILWGEEDHVRKLFDGADIECERRTVTFAYDDVDSWMAYTERVLGPIVMAKAALEPQGRWPELREKLRDLNERFNLDKGGGFRAEPEYLLTVVKKPG
jgi:ubiquinone/menaquinone biosynthesis C-methylase UbiE